MTADPPAEAVAELRRQTDADDPWNADDFEESHPLLAVQLPVILNAVLSGQLIPIETCNARMAAAFDAGVEYGHEQALWSEGMPEHLQVQRPQAEQAALEAMISRAREEGMREALNIANMNAWMHQGEDAHSKGMDAGARHQSQVIHDAISAADWDALLADMGKELGVTL
jgi:hypothetical protein